MFFSRIYTDFMFLLYLLLFLSLVFFPWSCVPFWNQFYFESPSLSRAALFDRLVLFSLMFFHLCLTSLTRLPTVLSFRSCFAGLRCVIQFLPFLSWFFWLSFVPLLVWFSLCFGLSCPGSAFWFSWKDIVVYSCFLFSSTLPLPVRKNKAWVVDAQQQRQVLLFCFFLWILNVEHWRSKEIAHISKYERHL